MPKFKIEAMVQLRRTYEIEAASAAAAEHALVSADDSSPYVVNEEEINEDLDDISEIKDDAVAA